MCKIRGPLNAANRSSPTSVRFSVGLLARTMRGICRLSQLIQAGPKSAGFLGVLFMGTSVPFAGLFAWTLTWSGRVGPVTNSELGVSKVPDF